MKRGRPLWLLKIDALQFVLQLVQQAERMIEELQVCSGMAPQESYALPGAIVRFARPTNC
jgi:hypothetical protein